MSSAMQQSDLSYTSFRRIDWVSCFVNITPINLIFCYEKFNRPVVREPHQSVRLNFAVITKCEMSYLRRQVSSSCFLFLTKDWRLLKVFELNRLSRATGKTRRTPLFLKCPIPPRTRDKRVASGTFYCRALESAKRRGHLVL